MIFKQLFDPARLALGGLMLAMASLIAYQRLSADANAALFVDRWPFWVGGAAIGLFVLVFLVATGKALGVSTGFQDACALPFDASVRRSWRLPFLLGIIGGGLVSAWGAADRPRPRRWACSMRW